jgi:acyl phosphate:glycerol-3-phosphate acyltransferase
MLTVTPDQVLPVTIALVIGLLLGSVLPADLLARIRGIDIRSVGDGNPGTVNAFRVLGWGPGLVTGLYDVSVGVVAIQIARLLGVAEGAGYLAGIMALVGHRFPVYLGFRGGGQGMAASAGMLVYGVGVGLSRGWLSPWVVAGLLVVVVAGLAVDRSGRTAALVMLPALVGAIVLGPGDWTFSAFMVVVAGRIWTIQLAATAWWRTRRAAARAGGLPHDRGSSDLGA